MLFFWLSLYVAVLFLKLKSCFSTNAYISTLLQEDNIDISNQSPFLPILPAEFN
jgi:hypothetical protein